MSSVALERIGGEAMLPWTCRWCLASSYRQQDGLSKTIATISAANRCQQLSEWSGHVVVNVGTPSLIQAIVARQEIVEQSPSSTCRSTSDLACCLQKTTVLVLSRTRNYRSSQNCVQVATARRTRASSHCHASRYSGAALCHGSTSHYEQQQQ
jgi:hypothetical protein